jgi:hypothetical protein
MSPAPGPHLSADEIDVWLTGALPRGREAHLDGCAQCLEAARAEREIVDQLVSLPLMSPAAGFADRVMASVVVADPFSLRALRRRVFASRRSLAIAATLALALLGSMAASIGWSLAHQQTLAAIGSWVVAQGSQAAWLGLRGVASSFLEQPWYEELRLLLANPGRLALASVLAFLTYAGGVLALRRLLALPTQQVAHASL